MQEPSPFNPIPPVVLAVFALIVGIEALFSLGQQGVFGGAAKAWRVLSIEDYAYAPRVLELLWQGRWDVDLAKRLVTYPFVHASFTHAAFAAVLWIALGKFSSQLYSGWQILAIFMVSAVGGALAYGAFGLATGSNMPLVGAYPGDFGMIGAFTYMTWLRLGAEGENRSGAFSMIIVLMGLQLVYSALFGPTPTWTAELAGFVLGGALAIALAPGGWAAFVARMRSR